MDLFREQILILLASWIRIIMMLLNLGMYVFEKIILFATDLGIQTCWLGGTFSKDSFMQLAGLNVNEFVAIISPVGYKKVKMRAFEAAMRTTIGADKRKPWNELFFNKNMQPLSENEVG